MRKLVFGLTFISVLVLTGCGVEDGHSLLSSVNPVAETPAPSDPDTDPDTDPEPEAIDWPVESLNTDYPTVPFATGLYLKDLNKDGHVDIISSSANDSKVGIIENNGDGTFKPVISFNMTSALAVLAEDFDNDGNVDLITTNYGGAVVSFIQGDGTTTFDPTGAPTYAVGANPNSLTTGDFNKDGYLDLAVSNFNSANVSILINKGVANPGEFNAAVNYAAGTQPKMVSAGDVDKDGNVDLVIDGSAITVLEGSAAGTFSATQLPTSDSDGLTLADADGDGELDIISMASSNIEVYKGNGDLTFTKQVSTYALGGINNYFIAAVDLNGDGNIDVASANASSNNISVLLGNGDLSFGANILYAQRGTRPEVILPADFDKDGIPDLVTTNNNASSTVSVMINLGDGTFAAPAP